MIVVTGDLRIAPENMEAMRQHMRPVLETTRKEEGCLSYSYAEDVLEPGLVRISERWLNWQSLEAHGETPHIAAWRDAMKKIGVIHIEVVAYEAGQGRKL